MLQRRAGHAAPRRQARRRTDVTAADIQPHADVEILNPDLHIATLNATGPARHRHHRRARAAATCRPTATRSRRPSASSRSTRSSRRCAASRSRSSPPVSSRTPTTTGSCSTSRPTARSRRARRSPRPAPRCARSSSSSRDMSDEPQGLELGEVVDGHRRLARPRPADRGPRPVRAPPQLPEAGPGQHHRRAAPQDRGRPARHHQLRPEVARRGHRRSSTSAACRSAVKE